MELGYASGEDIRWALNRMKKRLGEICLERGGLTEYELNSSLRLQKKRPEWPENTRYDGNTFR